ncbi:4Fe-4S binding protein [Pelobacter propionicus]|uniref:4Fe-4S ferredoxin, iron-sulfur binding domain protein n=1 Tax=Pelobacter propionicus (strain DSM 2379 / NBRC 103807 / OttBd1) TaxID=338966 RepID=A1ANI0_PELPD|nr:4Fe-4S binding protein [Pelobacter propionicus]ABK98900.1 4Fe-4S ferredoxin, iron-sulfur binding domain protein [Pelobacter propionicus DSM 2379]
MNLTRSRLLVQSLSFGILTYGGRFGLNLGHALPCLSCPYVNGCGGHCFLMALQGSFWGVQASLSALAGPRGLETLRMLALFILLALQLSKLWCGWICPFGTLQDALTWVRSRLGIPEARWSWATSDRLRWVKYIFLLLLLAIPLMIANLGLHGDYGLPFCQICPAKPLMPLFTGDTAHLAIDTTNAITTAMTVLSLLLAGGFLAGMFFRERFFCIFCPMLALLGLVQRFGLVRFTKNVNACVGCGSCARSCPLEIRTVRAELVKRDVMSPECMACMTCADSCAHDGSLSFHWLKWRIFASSAVGAARRFRKGLFS